MTDSPRLEEVFAAVLREGMDAHSAFFWAQRLAARFEIAGHVDYDDWHDGPLHTFYDVEGTTWKTPRGDECIPPDAVPLFRLVGGDQ